MRGSIAAHARALLAGATLAGFALLIACGTAAQPLAPDIVVVKTIDAPVADVWKGVDDAGRHRKLFRAQGGQGRAVGGRRIRALVSASISRKGRAGCEGCKCTA
jgi:hypothetical protein